MLCTIWLTGEGSTTVSAVTRETPVTPAIHNATLKPTTEFSLVFIDSLLLANYSAGLARAKTLLGDLDLCGGYRNFIAPLARALFANSGVIAQHEPRRLARK
jgi:hypothetical protein